jgi:hypothetical protein
MSRRGAFVRRAASAGLGVALLAGCAPGLPEPDPDAAQAEPLPVLTLDQGESVLAETGETIAAADQALDGGRLGARAAGPAHELRQAQYTLAQRSGGERPPSALTTADQVLILGATEGWPRTIMAVTEPPQGGNAPLLIVLRQAEPRDRYKLVSWVRLFPGVQTPEMAGPQAGSPQLPPDAEGLLASPGETVARYADVLAKGAESKHAGFFAADPYREQLKADLDASRASLREIAEVAFIATGERDSAVAMETADGGALVVGLVRTSTGFRKTLAGATLSLGGDIGDWLGDGQVPSRADARHASMVAFYVPPAGEGTVTVLGAERVLTDATKA